MLTTFFLMATAAITGNNDNDDDRIFVQVIEILISEINGCSNEFIVCCAGLGDGDEY